MSGCLDYSRMKNQNLQYVTVAVACSKWSDSFNMLNGNFVIRKSSSLFLSCMFLLNFVIDRKALPVSFCSVGMCECVCVWLKVFCLWLCVVRYSYVVYVVSLAKKFVFL